MPWGCECLYVPESNILIPVVFRAAASDANKRWVTFQWSLGHTEHSEECNLNQIEWHFGIHHLLSQNAFYI